MFVIIDIYSKNYQSLSNFLEFFCDEKTIHNLKLSLLKIIHFQKKHLFLDFNALKII